MPAELSLMLCTYLDHQDLRALATSSRSLCGLLLPEYLRRRGLVLKNTSARGANVQLYGLGGYASLGLWSVVRIFHPPEDMYCPIPYDVQAARSAMRLLIRFLREPPNTRNLRSFHIFLPGSNPYLLISELCQIQQLFCALSLRELCISGFCSPDYLSPPASLRSGWSATSRTLTSFTISSNHAFAPGLVRTTMGILKHSPIESLAIDMVSLNPCQWSTLLGVLTMMSLKELDIEGDIPRPALLRFLSRHRGLETIRIRGNIGSGRTLTSRSQRQYFLPNLRTLRAPLAVCCDIVERTSDTSNIFDLEVDVNRLHPFDPLLIRLMENLWRFRKLRYFGFRVRPSPISVTPQESSNDHDWDEHPACRLKQVQTLSFVQTQGRLSPGDIVCHHFLLLISFALSGCQNTMCALVQLFPTLETVDAMERESGVGVELIHAFCKAKPTLRVVNITSGSLQSNWEADVGCDGQ